MKNIQLYHRDKIINVDDLELLIAYLAGNITDFGVESWLAMYVDPALKSNPRLTLELSKDHVFIDSIKNDKLGMNFQLVQLGDISTFSNEDGNVQEYNLEKRSFNKNDFFEAKFTPNPFSHALTLGLKSSQSGEAIVQFKDVTGKQIRSSTYAIKHGDNTIEIDGSALPFGLLYYSVRIGDSWENGKLIKVE